MNEPVFEIEIVQPGRPTGKYRPIEFDLLMLEKVLYPDVVLPFDLGILSRTLTLQGNPLHVILLGNISHPPDTHLAVRLLGGIQADGTAPYLLAVSAADDHFAEMSSLSDISDAIRSELEQHLKESITADLCWLDAEALKPCIKDATHRYRLAEVEGYRPVLQPAWKPADAQGRVTSYTEIEHYTAAEYTFFQLPNHIQHYVSEYLSDDERILYAIHRPAIRSHRQRSFWGREKINQGVLILTNQRLIHLVELIPLGGSGVRYGFHTYLGALERLIEIKVETINGESVLLSTSWGAKDGGHTLVWETPIYTSSAISELTGFLENFLPEKVAPHALRRSGIPAPSELPPLNDPASNEPDLVNAINQRFSKILPTKLAANEKAHAWALWPAWYENKGYSQILLVTDSRIMIITDPALPQDSAMEIPLIQVATLEYIGSILESRIGLNLVERGKHRQIKLSFPYTAEGAFHRCFEAMRRCMAVIPLRRE